MYKAIVTVFVLSVISMSGQSLLPWYVVGSGGSQFTVGNNRVLSGTIGQTFIGVRSITDGSAISQGFWLPLDDVVSVGEQQPELSSSGVRNYPNPFSNSTVISVDLTVDGQATVRIYNMVGVLVRTLSADMSMAGSREIQFDGRGEGGEPLATGTYLYDVTIDGLNGEQTRRVQRMTIVR